MRLVVSTHAKLLVLDLDPSYQILNYEELSSGHHYGVALLSGESQSFLAKHNDRMLTRYRGNTSRSKDGMIEFRGRVGYVHQIAYANNGLYIANTTYNSIVFQDLSGETYHEYHFYGREDDHNHVNSVYPCGKLVVVLLHNRGKQPSEVVVLEHSRTQGFTLKERIGLKHWGCHNVFIDGKMMYYNASRSGKFVVMDIDERQVIRTIPFPGHTKGLAASKNHLIIGYSDHTNRENRAAAKGYLAILDRQKHSLISTIDLNMNGSIGNVNEIRLLDPEDEAHTGEESAISSLSSFSLSTSLPIHHFWGAITKRFQHILNRID